MTTPETGHLPNGPGAGTAAVIRGWVALYTKGLSTDEAADRRALIDADLWDEANAAEWMGSTSSLAQQRWSRLLRGLPADVTWRLQQRRGATTAPGRAHMRTSKVMLAAIAIVTAFYVFLLVGLLAQPDFRESTVMGVAIVGFGLAIVGLLVAIPRPPAGFVVGMLGIGILFVSMWWLFPFYLPLPIVLGYRLIRWQDAPPGPPLPAFEATARPAPLAGQPGSSPGGRGR